MCNRETNTWKRGITEAYIENYMLDNNVCSSLYLRIYHIYGKQLKCAILQPATIPHALPNAM